MNTKIWKTLVLAMIVAIIMVTPTKTIEQPRGKIKFKATKITTITYKPPYLEVRKTLEGPEVEKIFNVKQLKQEYKIEITVEEAEKIGIKPGEKIIEKETVESQGYRWPDHPYWYLYYNYPQWTYERYIGGGIFYEQADPINLGWIYTTEYQVNSWLTQHGWENTNLANVNYIYDPTYGWISQQHNVIKKPGPNGYDRYHVRLWQLSNGRVCGQAHVDKKTWHGHVAVLYEQAELECRATFYVGSWTVYPDSYWLDNYFNHGYEHYNNGYATQIFHG